METIQQLTQRLCPNGVPMVKIGDVCKCYAGATPDTKNSQYWENGTIQWMSSGEVNKGQVFATEKKITPLGYDKSSTKMVPINSVVIALAGQGKTRGTVAITRTELCTNQSLCAIIPNEQLIPDFLFHYLKGQYQTLRTISCGDGTRGGLNLKMINAFEIPMPPIEVQKRIVKVLDEMTAVVNELEAELLTELEARKKQYDYYRNKLLTFNEIGGIKWLTMKELGIFYGGLSGKTKNDFENGNAKFISYMNVYSNDAINIDVTDKVLIGDNEKQNKIQYGDIIFTGSSETKDDCAMTSVLTDKCTEDLYLNSFCFGFRFSDTSLFVPQFSKHLFRSGFMRKELVKTANGVTRFNVSKKMVAEIKIPLVPKSEQIRISNILNKMAIAVTDLQDNLQIEIRSRRQQYEYYRNKLLTFDQAA